MVVNNRTISMTYDQSNLVQVNQMISKGNKEKCTKSNTNAFF
jgi:hypothetical protein